MQYNGDVVVEVRGRLLSEGEAVGDVTQPPTGLQDGVVLKVL